MSRGIARIVWGIYVDRFVATVGNFKPLTIVQKLFILDVCGVPDHEKILGMHTTNKGTHRNQWWNMTFCKKNAYTLHLHNKYWNMSTTFVGDYFMV